MTIKQFLKLLEKTPRDWILSVDDELRRDANWACPIAAVLGIDGETGFQKEGWDAGINEKMQLRIISASDATPTFDGPWCGRVGFDVTLREQLLEACGINK